MVVSCCIHKSPVQILCWHQISEEPVLIVHILSIVGMTNKEVLESVERGYRMPCPPGCPGELYEIMLECWKAKPMERPTFETLQWKLEEFFVMDGDQYREPSHVR